MVADHQGGEYQGGVSGRALFAFPRLRGEVAIALFAQIVATRFSRTLPGLWRGPPPRKGEGDKKVRASRYSFAT
jgi:hypothetical protein